MPIHNCAPRKIRLEEMHHAQPRARRDVHQCLFVRQLRVCAVLETPHLFRVRELRVQLLQAGLTVCAEGRVVFEAREESVFVNVGVG